MPDGSYDVAQLSTSLIYQVRFIIGDTDTDDIQLADVEIAWLLAQASNNITRAAVAACQRLVARYSRLVDIDASDVSASYSQRVAHYRTLAAEIEAGNIGGGNAVAAVPYSGGTSLSDIATVNADTDKPRSEFVIGMHDNENTTGVRTSADELRQ